MILEWPVFTRRAGPSIVSIRFCLSLTLPTMLILNCGGDIREVQIHCSLPAKNSDGPSVQRTRQPIWSLAFVEDVLIREGSIPDCRLHFSLYDQPIYVLL
ncbi:unnamed protein product [Strongylus vulgaris]|uniref:Uncharacterized protein n=1 Tax=Strongylus vulgaris TaxID=40348 RepID=A0A3P7IY95_STRVU|nr:unnamed protein product [Strongylus vulgaris]